MRRRARAVLRWLIDEWQWPYAGALTAAFLLVLLPIVWSAEGAALAAVFLQLPVYMLHQLEEHAGCRFELYINQLVGRGQEVMGRRLIFWVNSLLVWVLFLVVLLLAFYVDLGLGLIATYTTGFNAFTHIASAVATRAYGPGLWTAIALMLPAAAWGSYEVTEAADPGLGLELLAIGVAVGMHVGLIALVARRALAVRKSAVR